MSRPFYCFDGVDGAGKTTQIQLFHDWLLELGHDVVLCRDPGTTALGEEIRKLLLSHSDTRIDMRAEMFLYMSARAQLVEEIIRPALNAGKTVIADRYLLANVVYQGHAGGMDPKQIWQVGDVATDTILPAITYVLDLPPQVAAGRRVGEPDRVEGRGEPFLTRVRNGFLAEAQDRSDIVIIDAAASPQEVQARIRSAAGQPIKAGDTP
ncbi:MAG: dTMP kinase [Pirellulaceae bacterium]|nr:dTMP kinase [Pirellulaceae bacterium]